MTPASNTFRGRLASLDILRGMDLFLLVILEPIIGRLGKVLSGPVWHAVAHQCHHVGWHGFVLWDIIMPLFMFMSGITIPFSMAKYKDGRAHPDKAFWTKLLRRFVLLWVLGMAVQGKLLTLDPVQFKWFSNTLQAIAVGYLATAILYVYGGLKLQIGAGVLCFAAYFAVFALAGGMDTTPEGNIAMTIDKAVLGMHRDGVQFLEDGTWAFKEGYQYTWILSSLNFIVTVLLGCLAGQILRRGPKDAAPAQNGLPAPSGRNAATLAIVGAALVAAGLLLDPVFPIIKKIWSSSMTLYSGGICCLAMALVYWWVDVRGHSRGLNWLKVLGMNSIAAYCISHIFNFTSVTTSVLYGLKHIVGDPWYGVIIACANALVLWFILRYMYKKGIFLKV